MRRPLLVIVVGALSVAVSACLDVHSTGRQKEVSLSAPTNARQRQLCRLNLESVCSKFNQTENDRVSYQNFENGKKKHSK
uniref:Putative secreted protein n=1 Tax=Anopheles marajoara TaxID=58244 RepID=A0A2M4CBR0_9DIPT